MRKVLVSHIDLDGYGCNIMASKFMSDVAEVHNVNYDELADCLCDIPRDVHLLITDLSIPESLEGLVSEFAYLTIIDHHVSTMWVHDAFRNSRTVDVKVDRRRCATWLFCDWMIERGIINQSDSKTMDWMERWRTYIDDYDRYVLKHEESERLNALLYISDRTRFVNDAVWNNPETVLSNNRARIDKYLNTQEEYIAQCQPLCLCDTIDGNYNIYLVFAEKYKSKIAQRLMATKGADLVYLADMHAGQMSIRSTKESRIDCSAIARSLDPEGGGHRNASGCRLLGIRSGRDDRGWATVAGCSMPIEDIPTYEDGDDE